MEGLEPSSKRGINALSTGLVIDLVFENTQAHDYQRIPYPLNLGKSPRLRLSYFRIFQHHFIQSSRNGAME